MNELFKSFQPTLTKLGLAKFGLSLQSSAPCTALKGVVHSYLQIRAIKPTPYPVIPDGTQSIFISPQGSIIGGAQAQTHDIQILQTGEYFGIRFHSGALRHFFNLDLSDITNQFVGNDYFPCKDFPELYHMIFEKSHYSQRANICESWLLQHYKPQLISRFDQALDLIYQSSGNVRVDTLANNVAWSSRHVNRIFQLYTGLNTKTFTKIIRLQQTCRHLYFSPNQSSNSNVELGFFDQAHLIKDFRKHLLSKPTEFTDRFMSDFYNQ